MTTYDPTIAAEDPVTRETMALEWIVESWHSHPPEFTSPPTMDEVRQMLRVLDSFDPLRAMLGEVVEALEGLVEGEGDGLRDLLKARIVLTRLRTLTPTKGGADDETR